ncbi:MAG: GTPase Era [Myxococcales bacterium]|jgi:GTP-binding protein Era|nr:GTPase Era [Myxococcales bacterium]
MKRGSSAKKKRAPEADGPSPAPPRAGRVAIVGRPNVGKSTLMNALVGEPLAITSSHPQTTRDRLSGVLTEGGVQYVFVDTPGIHAPRSKLGVRMNTLAEDAARGADVVLFVTDAALPSPADTKILATVPAAVPVVLVVNKVDTVRPKEKLLPTLEAWAKVREFSAIVPLSARTGDGAERLLAEIERHLPEGDAIFPEEELTDRPLRYFAAEYVREQILRASRAEVPHGVAVVVEEYDESRRVPRIRLVVHVAKESHKAIVLGERGERMRQIATSARARFEALAGRQVHLEIFVRATPGWQDNPRALSDLGYGGDTEET